MFDFQSFDGMVPTRSTWLPRPQVIDGHRLSMVEVQGSLVIVDEIVTRDAVARYWSDTAPHGPTTTTTAPRPPVRPPVPRPMHPDPLIRRAQLNL